MEHGVLPITVIDAVSADEQARTDVKTRVPHIIFVGPPGVGKSTAIEALELQQVNVDHLFMHTKAFPPYAEQIGKLQELGGTPDAKLKRLLGRAEREGLWLKTETLLEKVPHLTNQDIIDGGLITAYGHAYAYRQQGMLGDTAWKAYCEEFLDGARRLHGGAVVVRFVDTVGHTHDRIRGRVLVDPQRAHEAAYSDDFIQNIHTGIGIAIELFVGEGIIRREDVFTVNIADVGDTRTPEGTARLRRCLPAEFFT